jgi:hypothetical protein
VPLEEKQEDSALKDLDYPNCEDEEALKLRNRLTILLSYLSNNNNNTELGQYDYPNSLKIVSRILNSKAFQKILLYLLDHGAATDFILQYHTRLPRSTVKWARRELCVLRLIQPAIIARYPITRGPRTTVWMVEGALPGQIRDAVLLHQRLQSPKYRVALEVAQSLLDGYLKGKQEVTYREIVVQVKQLRLPFNTPDIAELTAQYLHEQGIRIWR